MIDDNTLYALYRDGDRDALSVLIDRHHGRLVQRMTKYGVAGAEAIAQDVFAKLAEVASKFDPATSDVVGWMNWLTDTLSREHRNWALADRELRIEHEAFDRLDIHRRYGIAWDSGDYAAGDRIMEEWGAEVERLVAA